MYFDQHEFDIRFEWGLAGVQTLAAVSDVVIIVDVLSFTTCVDIAVGNGGIVYPYSGSPGGLADFAAAVDAAYAEPGRSHASGFSLAPSSLVTMPAGTRLVLPSPNGSRLSLATGDVCTLAGCLRNAGAVAALAQVSGTCISVIAAGERWRPDGSLRPALEDLLGAGAIIERLAGTRSPEAELAAAGFQQARSRLQETLLTCSSGRELVGRGFEEDVRLAALWNVSNAAPQLAGGAYKRL